MSGIGGAPPCHVCGQRVYFNDEKNFMAQKWHKKCFKCCQCSKSLETGNANQDENLDLFCNGCYRKMYSTASQPAPPRGAYVNKEDGECCPRCGKRVFFAEQVLSLSRKWHKACFTCAACNKKVDSSSAADHEGELYCRSCHGRKFGPKGYGFAGGAGTMLSMDTGKANEVVTKNVPLTADAYVAPVRDQNGSAAPAWGGGDYCPRCQKQVFIAEKKQGAGNCYHITCFTCNACHHKLDSSSLTEKDGEIYCKSCYGKNFGPKGYGYGSGAGTLQMN